MPGMKGMLLEQKIEYDYATNTVKNVYTMNGKVVSKETYLGWLDFINKETKQPPFPLLQKILN